MLLRVKKNEAVECRACKGARPTALLFPQSGSSCGKAAFVVNWFTGTGRVSPDYGIEKEKQGNGNNI